MNLLSLFLGNMLALLGNGKKGECKESVNMPKTPCEKNQG